MSLLLVLQVPVIQLVLGTTYVRPSHPTDGVIALHMQFLSLDLSQNDSRLTVFLTKGKRVFHMSILSLVHSGNGLASGRLSYGQASTYRPHPTYYVNVLVFVCPYVHMKLEPTYNFQTHPRTSFRINECRSNQCKKTDQESTNQICELKL